LTGSDLRRSRVGSLKPFGPCSKKPWVACYAGMVPLQARDNSLFVEVGNWHKTVATHGILGDDACLWVAKIGEFPEKFPVCREAAGRQLRSHCAASAGVVLEPRHPVFESENSVPRAKIVSRDMLRNQRHNCRASEIFQGCRNVSSVVPLDHFHGSIVQFSNVLNR
jgi:hypothetical protein